MSKTGKTENVFTAKKRNGWVTLFRDDAAMVIRYVGDSNVSYVHLPDGPDYSDTSPMVYDMIDFVEDEQPHGQNIKIEEVR